MEHKLNISELFSNSWKTFTDNWLFVVITMVIVMAIQLVLTSFGYNIDPVTNVATGSLLVTGLGTIVSLILGIGTIDIFLGLTRGEKREYMELVTTVTVKKFFVYFAASILYAIMLIIGFILFVIPGIIVMLVFLPFVYFIVDKDAGVIDSLKMAKRSTKGNRGAIFLVIIAVSILNGLGALLLGVGLLITMPITMFVMAYMYRALIGDMNSVGSTEDTQEDEVEEVIEVEEVEEA